ncbi:MAG: twin-arginine translocase subunit TatC [Pirellulaceae bacterium]|nr:twin-arginine translocase subunit TatC [Pirellulaceae bacterium]
MSPRPEEKDLFADSTMTFGEHLEELRTCLFKSLVALVIGLLIGLLPWFGGNVVSLIQTPLVRALSAFYENQEGDAARRKLEEMQADGEVLPDDPAKIAKFVKDNHILPRQVFVDPEEVLLQLRRHDPERFGPPATAAPQPAKPGDDADDAERWSADKKLIPLFLWTPTADDSRVRTKSLSVQEPFMVYLKASLLVGAILSSPYIFFQIWSFVAAGLYPHEKRYVHVFLPFSLGLFLLGAATAFFFVFEPVLTFLFGFNQMLGIEIEPRITEWMGFVLVLPLGFGVSFQLPLVMLFLERIGVFDIKAYLSKWRVAILVIFIISMFLTPADPTSMFLMAVPLTVLYFLGVLLCKYMPRRSSPFDDE